MLELSNGEVEGWARFFISWIYILTKIVDLESWGGGGSTPTPRQFEPWRHNVKLQTNLEKPEILMASFNCSGQMPSDAELNYLENAKKLQMYGVHIYPAKVIFLFFKLFFHIHNYFI